MRRFIILCLTLVIFLGTTFLRTDKISSAPLDVNTENFNIAYIGKDTSYQTPVYIFKGVTDGPIVMIEAGIHGDELAGVYAIDRILNNINIESGKLFLFPRMNLPACNRKIRFINKDLNLVFPGKENGEFYEYKLAREIFDFVGKEKVEYLATLHESIYLHNSKDARSFGQTVVYGVKLPPLYLNKWITELNKQVDDPKEIFYPYYFPVEHSSTETMVSAYNLKGGFCIETWRGFEMERRIKLQTKIILTFMDVINLKYTLKKIGKNGSY
jgi:uncharacterized protein